MAWTGRRGVVNAGCQPATPSFHKALADRYKVCRSFFFNFTKGTEMAEEKTQMKGAFIASLKRNNKEIRDDRATAIAEKAQVMYRRKVEDLELQLNELKRDQEGMLDMSPDNVFSLKMASDFKADEFVARDLKLGVEIRETEIKLDIAKKQYQHLFEEGA